VGRPTYTRLCDREALARRDREDAGLDAGAAGLRLEADVHASARRDREGRVRQGRDGRCQRHRIRPLAGLRPLWVNPDATDPFVGISERWDDNEAQALVRWALDPVPEFLYYEVPVEGDRWIGVVHVVPRGGFFVVTRDLGKLREGQSMIRQGSTTRGVRRADQLRLYLTPGYGYAEQLLQQYGAAAAMTNAQTARLQQLDRMEQQLIRQMYASVGLPPPF
jgi:hypothetical protein